MAVVKTAKAVALAAAVAAADRWSLWRLALQREIIGEIFLKNYIDNLLYKPHQTKSTNIEGQNGHTLSSAIYIQQSH
jgi:hypothetical protein